MFQELRVDSKARIFYTHTHIRIIKQVFTKLANKHDKSEQLEADFITITVLFKNEREQGRVTC